MLNLNNNLSFLIKGEKMSNIKVFEDKKVRTQWNAEKEDWYSTWR